MCLYDAPINVSPHSPPPGRSRANIGDLSIPQIKFPLMWEGFGVQIPQSTGGFEPQAVAHIKTGYKSSLYYAKPGQIPQYGANISGQIRSNPPVWGGGVVGATH